MKVFISWSGSKSLAVAEVLREELPCLINELEIFVSSEDIEKGSAWFPKIANELEKSDFGIICLTPENLQSRWVHFEAGVLAGKFSQSKVAPLLIEFDKYEQIPPPLSELNLAMFTKVDFFKLLCTLNKNTVKPLSDAILGKTFDRSWQHITEKIQGKIKALPISKVVKRTPDEILDEILGIVRSIAANSPAVQPLSGGVFPVNPEGLRYRRVAGNVFPKMSFTSEELANMAKLFSEFGKKASEPDTSDDDVRTNASNDDMQ